MKANSEGYTMIGDQIVYDPKMEKTSDYKLKEYMGLNKCAVNIYGNLRINKCRNNKFNTDENDF